MTGCYTFDHPVIFYAFFFPEGEKFTVSPPIVKHECNKPYLEKSLDDIICLLEKIQSNNGELETWKI